MPTVMGQRSTFAALDQDLHINIESAVNKYPDAKIPLVKRWNGSNFKNQVLSHKYEWSTRELRPVSFKPVDLVVANNATSMIIDTVGALNAGDVFMKPSGEKSIVTKVTGGTNITFASVAGTPEAMTNASTCKVIGVAEAQGALAGDAISTGKSDLYNYTQIFEDVVDLSGTEHEALIHGELTSAQQISDVQKLLVEKLNSTLIHGVRVNDTVNKRTYTGGVKYFVDTYNPAGVIDFGGAAVWNTDAGAFAKIDAMLSAVENYCDKTPTLYVGTDFMAKLKLAQDDTVRSTFDNSKRGIGVVDVYKSVSFGDIDIVLIRDRSNMMANLAFVGDDSTVGYKPMRNRGWFTKPVPFGGDGYRWQVLGEYIFKMDLPKAWAYGYNFV